MARTSATSRNGSMASVGPHAEVRCPICGGAVTKAGLAKGEQVLSGPDWVTAYERRDAPAYRRKPLLAAFYGCNACDYCATVADHQKEKGNGENTTDTGR